MIVRLVLVFVFFIAVSAQLPIKTQEEIEQRYVTRSHLRPTSRNLTESSCVCPDESAVTSTRQHLKQLLRISSVRLVTAIQNTQHHANAESSSLLSLATFRLLHSLSSSFPRLAKERRFQRAVEDLERDVRSVLYMEEDVSQSALHSNVSSLVHSFFRSAFPSAFLCASLHVCRQVEGDYAGCLSADSDDWRHYFGNEPEKVATQLTHTLHRFRLVDRLLTELSADARRAEQAADGSCVERLAAVTKCSCAPVGYCGSHCSSSSFSCFSALSSAWDSKLQILSRVVNEFDDGFRTIERSIPQSIVRSVDQRSPTTAIRVVARCGPVRRQDSPAEAGPTPRRPAGFPARAVALVEKLASYRGWWRQLSEKMCSEGSREQRCWDGEKVVYRSVHAITDPIEEELSKKSVLPYRDSHSLRVITEGSADWKDEDDEDNGSGSGDGIDDEDGVVEEQAIYKPSTKPSFTPTMGPALDPAVTITASSAAAASLLTLLIVYLI